MKKKPYYLKMYMAWMPSGKMPVCKNSIWAGGLCGTGLDGDEMFELMKPDFDGGLWGYNGDEHMGVPAHFDAFHSFTPLRQTIVLFMAAMNNEL